MIFKHIFGTWEDHAENYDNAVTKLYKNEKKIGNTVKDNIIGSKTAISNINDTIHALSNNKIELNDAVDQIIIYSTI